MNLLKLLEYVIIPHSLLMLFGLINQEINVENFLLVSL